MELLWCSSHACPRMHSLPVTMCMVEQLGSCENGFVLLRTACVWWWLKAVFLRSEPQNTSDPGVSGVPIVVLI